MGDFIGAPIELKCLNTGWNIGKYKLPAPARTAHQLGGNVESFFDTGNG